MMDIQNINIIWITSEQLSEWIKIIHYVTGISISFLHCIQIENKMTLEETCEEAICEMHFVLKRCSNALVSKYILSLNKCKK